jgi:hypothetical protein
VCYTAAYSSKHDLMQKIWEMSKERLTTEAIKIEMFLSTDVQGRNACNTALFRGKLSVTQKIWNLAKKRPTTE